MNSLLIILSSAELIIAEAPAESRISRDAEQIRTSALHVRDLVDGLRNQMANE